MVGRLCITVGLVGMVAMLAILVVVGIAGCGYRVSPHGVQDLQLLLAVPQRKGFFIQSVEHRIQDGNHGVGFFDGECLVLDHFVSIDHAGNVGKTPGGTTARKSGRPLICPQDTAVEIQVFTFWMEGEIVNKNFLPRACAASRG